MTDEPGQQASSTVLVLGAGFTRALAPHAPLATDAYDSERLLLEFGSFSAAKELLEAHLRKYKGSLNMEELMTRLQSGMPYDSAHESVEVYSLLLSRVKHLFLETIRERVERQVYNDELLAFASCVLNSRIDVITFNYDDLLDHALYQINPVVNIPVTDTYWHPDGGYGFFCRPSEVVKGNPPVAMDVTGMLLLKLHGSLNWRVKIGYAEPYTVDAIVHHESWSSDVGAQEYWDSGITHQLEEEPFIVPPVLSKSALVEQPILRLIWTTAFDKLQWCQKVVFIGYSMPTTDLAARHLFQESTGGNVSKQVEVVNFTKGVANKNRLKKAYRDALPDADLSFCFDDARQWAQAFVANECPKTRA